MLHSQVTFIYFSYHWGSLKQSPFSYFDLLCSCFIFLKMLWWKLKFQWRSWMLQYPRLKITNPKNVFFLPASSVFLPFCRLVYNKRATWIMIRDGKYVISMHSQYFVAAGERKQQTLGEGKPGEKETPLIIFWLHLFVSKKQEENHQSHNLQVSFARDTPKGSTSHCGLISWLLTEFSWKNGTAERHCECPCFTRTFHSHPSFKHVFVASKVKTIFSADLE